MIEHVMDYWPEHILLATWSHAALGFGLAVVLQRWRRGSSFVPVAVGWVLLGFAVVTHALAFMS